MKRSFLSVPKRLFGVICLMTLAITPAAAASECPALLQHTFPNLLDEQPMPLCQFQGKVILVVNTASYCGFTSQYDGLEKLYARLKSQGLIVLGFPSNDFGQQEPGSKEQISDFCRMTYGVQFPMVDKSVVKGKGANPFYLKLAEITGSVPRWNFHKYLINRDGTKVVAFGSSTEPDDEVLLARINEFLK